MTFFFICLLENLSKQKGIRIPNEKDIYACSNVYIYMINLISLLGGQLGMPHAYISFSNFFAFMDWLYNNARYIPRNV
jgi:hypothetical protein